MELPSNYHIPASEAADEICDLFDQLSFTAEYPIDPAELRKMDLIIPFGNRAC